jgi:hypothetical protein
MYKSRNFKPTKQQLIQVKKLYYIAIFLISAIASAMPIGQSIIERLLNFTLEEAIGNDLLDKVWNESSKYGFDGGASSAYTECRGGVYEKLKLSEIIGAGDDSSYWNTYYQARTIVVARMKDHFHSGDALEKFAAKNIPRFVEKYNTLDGEHAARVYSIVSDARIAFEMALDPAKRIDCEKRIDAFKVKDPDTIGADILRQNLSAADTAKMVQSQMEEPKKVGDVSFKDFGNKYVAEFALRRHKEGGDKLVRKYLMITNSLLFAMLDKLQKK